MLDKIKWFWKYYRNYKYILAVLIILTPIQAAFQVTIPRMVEFAVDYLKYDAIPDNFLAQWIAKAGAFIGIPTFASYPLALVSLGVNAILFYAFVQSHRAWMNLRLEWLFRQEAFNGITLKGPDFFNRFRTGDTVTRLTDDVAEKLSWFACSGIFRLYEALLFVTFTITMMVLIDPLLTLMVGIPIPILIVIFFKSSSILDRRYDRLQSRISKLNAIMEACFSGARVVKSYIQEKAQKAKFDEVAQDRRKAEIATVKAMTVIESLYMYVWQFGVIIVLLAGGYMVINAGLSHGKLVAFIFYIAYLMYPMFDIGQFLVKSRQSGISIDRLVELEKVKPMVKDEGILPINGDVKGRLEFVNASFGFEDNDRQIIDNVSLQIEPGERVAVVGKVGAGKTWLVRMITRLVDPTSGYIKLDGRDLREYRLEDLRRSIGFVPQEPVLFSDTVRNNILFGRKGVSKEDLQWAADISQLSKAIEDFPQGLETQIGTRGVSISGGQKQRLSLARALVGKPKILILDDCTSALDSRTEAALWSQLEKVMPGRTVILITHRPDMLEKADKIFLLENGKLISTGTHHQMIEDEHSYAKLYKRYLLAQQVGSVT